MRYIRRRTSIVYIYIGTDPGVLQQCIIIHMTNRYTNQPDIIMILLVQLSRRRD